MSTMPAVKKVESIPKRPEYLKIKNYNEEANEVLVLLNRGEVQSTGVLIPPD